MCLNGDDGKLKLMGIFLDHLALAQPRPSLPVRTKIHTCKHKSLGSQNLVSGIGITALFSQRLTVFLIQRGRPLSCRYATSLVAGSGYLNLPFTTKCQNIFSRGAGLGERVGSLLLDPHDVLLEYSLNGNKYICQLIWALVIDV